MHAHADERARSESLELTLKGGWHAYGHCINQTIERHKGQRWVAFVSIELAKAHPDAVRWWFNAADSAYHALERDTDVKWGAPYGSMHDPDGDVEAERIEWPPPPLNLKPLLHIGYEYEAVGPPHGGGLAHLAIDQTGTTIDMACSIGGFFEPDEEVAVGKALLDLVAASADDMPLAFATVGTDNRPSRTALEIGLQRRSEKGRAEARRVLRGYSWVTVAPAEIAARLAADSRRDDYPSLETTTSKTGCLIIRAAPSCIEYNAARMTELLALLRPVLPSGTPRPRRRHQLEADYMIDASAGH